MHTIYAWHSAVWCSVVSDSTVRSGEFSKAMLRRMACDGVKSESVDDSDIEYVWDTRCRSSDQHQFELHVCVCVW